MSAARGVLPAVGALLALGASSDAGAAGLGLSADIELLRPTFSLGGLPGVEGWQAAEVGTLSAGLFGQYSRDPLLLWALDRDQEAGRVVSHRFTTVLGGSFQASRRFAVRAQLPLLAQWGTERPEVAGDGAGTGDLGVGGQLLLVETGPVAAGLAADLILPTAPRQAWMGERDPRTRSALFASLDLDWMEVHSAVGLEGRATVVSPEAFHLGSRFTGDVGLRQHLDGRDASSLFASVLSRVPLGEDATAEELAVEAVGGFQLRRDAEQPWTMVLGGGRGLTQGYGTTEWRTFLSLRWDRPRPEPEPVAVVVFEPPPPEPLPPPPVIEEPDPPVEEEERWEEDELARIDGERIVIRDPIQFEYDTERILPESLPILVQVSTLLRENPQIAHLVIEGHASEEGDLVYNYDLSIRRARAVWEQLVRGGVNADRLSYRGMGEVLPVTEGQTEGELAASRRVEFHIVRQLDPLEPEPTYREGTPLPWVVLEEAEAPEPARLEVPEPERVDLPELDEDEEEAAPELPIE